ncbi:predicted protein [Naegleria gruberi]|uniref:Predicted protein n=1 Tax=Naegleria gruberi TaxID=5762 RepID=D2VYK5_NAEGR|nr:uncharacterized protein NAEGRDRAFT_74153 [Naegleria gruberi]EFC38073.1 predicted protein [Naegleria gruberi]|eukprot:XP_002670817.1 predicted protein [Naegleria gruberi strain NEG-M]
MSTLEGGEILVLTEEDQISNKIEMFNSCPLSEVISSTPKRKIENDSNNHQMKFVIISDTHSAHDNLELPDDGDVLVHCGDFTNKGLFGEVNSFFEFLRDKCDGKFKYIIVIVDNCGNDIKIHGTRFRSKWKFPPFMRDSLRKKDFDIPKDIDILLSHFPSDKGKLDSSRRASTELTELINSSHFTKLKIHCFGHVHASRGHYYESETDRLFVNAASIKGDKKKKVVNKPFAFYF